MITGTVITPAGNVSQIATRLDYSDWIGAVKVRWGFNRNNYRIEPGLYATGNPSATSDVFVSANYKLSFDHVRKNLDGIDAWILVLDTKGINVWCAAGKGTFGTAELVRRIDSTGLEKIVSHRRIIVPQLGATGVSAHQVKALTTQGLHNPGKPIPISSSNPISINSEVKINQGFQVAFGPVRAADIKKFIANGYKSTPEMSRIHFNFMDRLRLIPVDLIYGKYKLLAAFAVIFILSGLNSEGIRFEQSIDKGIPAILYIFSAFLTGIVVTPLLLPYLPVRMFAFKGMISGTLVTFAFLLLRYINGTTIEIISWFLIISSISSFMAMNFTGASTYTSLSGVKKEMRIFVPIQISFVTIGLLLLVINNLTI